jgi:hypothetical protein
LRWVGVGGWFSPVSAPKNPNFEFPNFSTHAHVTLPYTMDPTSNFTVFVNTQKNFGEIDSAPGTLVFLAVLAALTATLRYRTLYKLLHAQSTRSEWKGLIEFACNVQMWTWIAITLMNVLGSSSHRALGPVGSIVLFSIVGIIQDTTYCRVYFFASKKPKPVIALIFFTIFTNILDLLITLLCWCDYPAKIVILTMSVYRYCVISGMTELIVYRLMKNSVNEVEALKRMVFTPAVPQSSIPSMVHPDVSNSVTV